MNSMTFLEDDELFGNRQLDIISKRGKKAAITDFSILLGGYVSDYIFVNSDNCLENRTGYYWTKTDDSAGDVLAV